MLVTHVLHRYHPMHMHVTHMTCTMQITDISFAC